MGKKAPATAEELRHLKKSMESAELDFANAKLAYYGRTEYKGELVAYENLARRAEEFIAANYAFQKARFGRIRIKLSVSRLMRE
jgi:hypothetical protein